MYWGAFGIRSLRQKLTEFIRTGVEPGQDAATRERVLVMNVTTSVMLGMTLMCLPFLGRSGSAVNDLSTLLSLLVQSLILAVNMSGRFRIARLLFLGLNQGLLFFSSATNYTALNLHFFYFQCFVFPEILFGRGEKWFSRFFLGTAVVSFFLFELIPPPWISVPPLDPAVLRVGARLMTVNATVYLIVAVAFLSRIRDIHEEQDADHRARLLMSAKMAALGEMAGGMAHEINNPLTIIRLKADQMLRTESGMAPEDEVAQGARVIVKHTDRIASIIRGLRSFARDGQSDPFCEAALSEILLETVALCRARFAHHGIELRMLPPNPALRLECRPVQVEQILVNLLNNSFDALEKVPERWVEVNIRDRGASVEISVTDSGPGIHSQIAGKILQPFFTTKPVGKGTGLGLSVSLGIARSHGGDLYLDRLSSRTKFVLVLPKHQSPGLAVQTPLPV